MYSWSLPGAPTHSMSTRLQWRMTRLVYRMPWVLWWGDWEDSETFSPDNLMYVDHLHIYTRGTGVPTHRVLVSPHTQGTGVPTHRVLVSPHTWYWCPHTQGTGVPTHTGYWYPHTQGTGVPTHRVLVSPHTGYWCPHTHRVLVSPRTGYWCPHTQVLVSPHTQGSGLPMFQYGYIQCLESSVPILTSA